MKAPTFRFSDAMGDQDPLRYMRLQRAFVAPVHHEIINRGVSSEAIVDKSKLPYYTHLYLNYRLLQPTEICVTIFGYT